MSRSGGVNRTLEALNIILGYMQYNPIVFNSVMKSKST